MRVTSFVDTLERLQGFVSRVPMTWVPQSVARAASSASEAARRVRVDAMFRRSPAPAVDFPRLETPSRMSNPVPVPAGGNTLSGEQGRRVAMQMTQLAAGVITSEQADSDLRLRPGGVIEITVSPETLRRLQG